MDPSSLYPTLVLKVNLGCCRACVVKMDNLLEKTDGVHAFDIAPEAGLVTVWGKVDPAKLIKKIKKFNRNAELLSYEEPKKNAPERVSVGQQTNNDHHHMEGNSGASHGHGDHHAPPVPNFHPPLHPHYPPSPPPDWRPPPPPPPPDWQPQPPPPPPPHYYGPHHIPANYNNMTHYFNDENTTGCLIM